MNNQSNWIKLTTWRGRRKKNCEEALEPNQKQKKRAETILHLSRRLNSRINKLSQKKRSD